MRRRSPTWNNSVDSDRLLHFGTPGNHTHRPLGRTQWCLRLLVFIIAVNLFLSLAALTRFAHAHSTWRVVLCTCRLLSAPKRLADAVLIAHRGSEWPWPENSIPALLRGADAVRFVELDVALSKDKDVVLMHDQTVDRTTLNGSGTVCDLTVQALTSLVLAPAVYQNRNLVGYPSECLRERSPSLMENTGSSVCVPRIPTLDAVFRALPADTRYMLDVKVCFDPKVHVSESTPAECNDCVHLRDRVAQLMQKFRIREDNTIFTSTDINTLRHFASKFSSSSFAFSADLKYRDYSIDDFMRVLDQDDWDAVCIHFGLAALRPDLTQAIQLSKSNRTGAFRQIYAWTVRRNYHARMALCGGVANLIVADPVHMIGLIRSTKS